MDTSKIKEIKKGSPLENIVDFETLKIKVENLSERQKEFGHLIDPRFFVDDVNPFREGKSKLSGDYKYETPIELEEDLFYLHPLMDPAVLEQGAVRRFPSGINEKYISEKYFEDKWVSKGNDDLSKRVEDYIATNIEKFKKQDRIKIIDIGPCGGAITTLFVLRALDRHGLLDKAELALLDIVPNVLEATMLGKFTIPNEMIKEYDLRFAEENGEKYKKLLADGVLLGVKEWYADVNNPKSPYTDEAIVKSDERAVSDNQPRVKYFRGDGEQLPPEVSGKYDIVLSAYTHHHMNLHGRKMLCEQMEVAAKHGGFVGVADFYVQSYQDYMKWYKPHFEKYGDAPPVECPLISGKQLASWFKNMKIENVENAIERTFVFGGVKL